MDHILRTDSSSKLDVSNIIHVLLFCDYDMHTNIHTYSQTAYEHSSNIKDNTSERQQNSKYFDFILRGTEYESELCVL